MVTDGSWPSAVLVEQSVYIATLNQIYYYYCGGTLISRNVILTSAQCKRNQVTIDSVVYNVTTNRLFATIESMFQVYIGTSYAKFVGGVETLDPSGITTGVSSIIIVGFLFFMIL